MILSVVTPSYNSARYIAETLDSVAALGVAHEHIVIDGGSDDGTAEILEGRDDPALRWVSEPDRGQTHAVNKGLERASGDILAWLNADDTYHAGAVERALEIFEREPETMVVYGGISFTDAEGVVRRKYVPAEWSFRRYLFVGDYIPTPSIIFRRAAYERAGPLDERWVDAADYDFYLRMMHGVRVVRHPEPIVRFRYHPDSKTARDALKAQGEAMEIRLGWARGPIDRGLMRAINDTKLWVLPKVSGWPDPYGQLRSRGSER